MLSVIDRYLLRQVLLTCLVMTGIGLAVLLLERVIYLVGLVANPNNALGYVGQMLLLLTPHYLGIALPAAFFFGVLLTFGRLKQDGEFVVLMAAGCGLARLLRPVFGLAVLMALRGGSDPRLRQSPCPVRVPGAQAHRGPGLARAPRCSRVRSSRPRA